MDYCAESGNKRLFSAFIQEKCWKTAEKAESQIDKNA